MGHSIALNFEDGVTRFIVSPRRHLRVRRIHGVSSCKGSPDKHPKTAEIFTIGRSLLSKSQCTAR